MTQAQLTVPEIFCPRYLWHSPPVSHLRLQTCDFCWQPVDLLLRPDDIAEVHFVAVEALMGPGRPWQEGGSGRGGSGHGSSGDGQQRGTGGGRLSRVLQPLDFFLESTLPSFQVADLHLGNKQKQTLGPFYTTKMSYIYITICRFMLTFNKTSQNVKIKWITCPKLVYTNCVNVFITDVI